MCMGKSERILYERTVLQVDKDCSTAVLRFVICLYELSFSPLNSCSLRINTQCSSPGYLAFHITNTRQTPNFVTLRSPIENMFPFS